MLASFIFFSSLVLCTAVERDITRDYFGDIFRMQDCHVDKRTPCDAGGSRYALEVPGRPCYCQCAPSHFTYREDRAICVREVRECYMSVFYRPHSVESIPLVFLPTSGQLVHPDAHLSLAGRKKNAEGFPKCKASISQYMTPEGWKTISREGSHGGSIFGLFLDGNKTFLQFLGNSRDRHTLQQHLILVRLYCKLPDYAPFETCVAIRVGWSPGVDPLENSSNTSSKTNMMVVGLSLGVLGLVYVLAVLVYLKIRRRILVKGQAADAKGKPRSNPPDVEQSIDPTKRLDMYHTHTLGCHRGDGLGVPSWGQRSSVEVYNRNWADRPGVSGSEFQAQDFQLQPEFFEPEFLASPPKQMVEFLERLQSSVAFARHRLRSYYRYRPTLIGIPEDDYFYQDQVQDDNKVRRSMRFNQRPRPDGCSSTLFAETLLGEAPRPPPRKARIKKKSDSSSTDSNHSKECNVKESTDFRNITVSEEEKEEIKCAMDTLNDTLEALELDIFRQDLANHASDASDEYPSRKYDEGQDRTGGEKSTGMSSQKLFSPGKESCSLLDVDSDSREFESSSSSSLSVVTVLNHNPKVSEIARRNSPEKVYNRQERPLGPVNACLINLEDDSHEEKGANVNSMNNLSNLESFRERKCTPGFNVEQTSSSEIGEDSLETEPVRDTTVIEKVRTNSIAGSDKDSLVIKQGLNESKNSDGSEVICSNCEHKIPNVARREDEMDSAAETIDTLSSSSNVESYQRCKETEILKVEESLRKHKYKNKLNILKNEKDSTASNTPDQSIKRGTRKLKRHNGKKWSHDSVLNDGRSPNKEEILLANTNMESAILEILQKYRNASNSTLDISDGGIDTEMTDMGESDLDSVDTFPTKLPKADDETNLSRPSSVASIRTNMTQDSLDPSGSPVGRKDQDVRVSMSLVDAWINRLAKSSSSSTGNRSKAKKATLQTDEWNHVCDKQNKDPCPVHEGIPSLIDKLANCSLRAMADCDVATYFQNLKQDLLSENFKSWLASHPNIKSTLSVSSRRNGKDSLQKKPLLSPYTSDSSSLQTSFQNCSTDCSPAMTWSSTIGASKCREQTPVDVNLEEQLESSTKHHSAKDANIPSKIEA